MRAILALAVVAAACFLSYSYGEHHSFAFPEQDAAGNVVQEGDNPFIFLYGHLIPVPLVKHAAPGHADEHAGDGHHAKAPLLFAVPVSGALEIAAHRTPEDPGYDGYYAGVTNLQIFQFTAVLLVLILLSGVPNSVRSGGGDRLSRIFAGWCMWIRDEMVYPAMGRDTGRKFLPFFLSIFFFILFMNLLGLVPFSATATASVFVTAALATITLVSMIVFGMVAQGPLAFWKNLVPHVPLALWPLMFVVELVGLCVKPFALMIRLFANMTGGHMVVLSFMGLIFYFAISMGASAGYGIAPVGVGFAVFIMIIEIFVAMLQAFIFTQLSILFIQASVHPEH